MSKISCSCGDDSNKVFKNTAPDFFTYNLLDNTFVPKFNNPSRTLRDLVKKGAPSSLVDRANCNTCNESVTTQDKLKVRKKDRPTPYRVPYNHYRKVSSCITDCVPNVKVNKDLSCNTIDCKPVNYAISRQVDKYGVKNLNNNGNYKSYLQQTGKTYYLNTFGILPENSISGKNHTYKIGALNNTVKNINSNTEITNCRLGYEIITSQQNKKFTLSRFNTTTKKYSNPVHRTSGSVSSKSHIHRKKFRAKLAGQGANRNIYNNCINGQLCNLYMVPGPNTKLFMGKTAKQSCIPPRINGMKQKCPV